MILFYSYVIFSEFRQETAEARPIALRTSFYTVLLIVQEYLEGHQPEGEMAGSKASLFSISTQSQCSLNQEAGVYDSYLLMIVNLTT